MARDDRRTVPTGARTMRFLGRSALSIGTTLLAHGVACGQVMSEPSGRLKLDPPERFTIGIGVYLTSFDSSIRLDSGTLRGTRIDLEKDLGLAASQTLFRADAQYRLTKRQYVLLSYYTIGRSADRTLLARDIRYGDEVFTVNSRINSFLDTQFVALSYRYSFLSSRRAELGITLGASVASLRTGIALSARVTGPGEPQEADVGTDAKFVAPLPLTGLYGRWRIAPRVILAGSFQYIKLTFSDITGSNTDADIRVEYFPLPRLGVGLGYAFNRIKLDPIRQSDFRGQFIYQFDGLQLYAKYAL